MHDNSLTVPGRAFYRRLVHIAILTFDGFNELDSLIALGVLNRIKSPGWRVTIATPSPRVRSMNGVTIESMASLDQAIMGVLRRLDPARQLIAGQCSGALVLAKLGLLDGVPACTDLTTKPWVVAAGVQVLNQPFFASGNLATAGGCLASPYLAAWIIARLRGQEAAEGALHYVAPVGEKEEYVARAWRTIDAYLPAASHGAVCRA